MNVRIALHTTYEYIELKCLVRINLWYRISQLYDSTSNHMSIGWNAKSPYCRWLGFLFVMAVPHLKLMKWNITNITSIGGIHTTQGINLHLLYYLVVFLFLLYFSRRRLHYFAVSICFNITIILLLILWNFRLCLDIAINRGQSHYCAIDHIVFN